MPGSPGSILAVDFSPLAPAPLGADVGGDAVSRRRALPTTLRETFDEKSLQKENENKKDLLHFKNFASVRANERMMERSFQFWF